MSLLLKSLKYFYKSALKYDQDKANQGVYPNLVYGSIFTGLMPHPKLLNAASLQTTKEMWKYKSLHEEEVNVDVAILTSFLTSFGVKNFYQEICTVCKMYKGFTEVNILEVKDNAPIYKYYIECKSNSGTTKITLMPGQSGEHSYLTTTFLAYWNKRRVMGIKTTRTLLVKICKKLVELQKQHYPLFRNTDNKVIKELIHKITKISQVAIKYPSFRWVILVHGKPGTGKSWLFNHLQFYLDHTIQLSKHETLATAIDGAITQEIDIKPLKHPTTYQSYGELVTTIPIEVIDEVDKVISNYSSSIERIDTVDVKQAKVVSVFKEKLDNAQGLVILITNHLDKLDASAIRDGRVNEIICMDEHFYSIEEKKEILTFYQQQYGLTHNTPSFSDKELREITIAKIESICKKNMIEEGMGLISSSSPPPPPPHSI